MLPTPMKTGCRVAVMCLTFGLLSQSCGSSDGKHAARDEAAAGAGGEEAHAGQGASSAGQKADVAGQGGSAPFAGAGGEGLVDAGGGDGARDPTGDGGGAGDGVGAGGQPPTSVGLKALPITGLRDNAEIPDTAGITQDPAGSFTFITRHQIKRLSADLSTITPVAGKGPPAGFADGPAATATFNLPQGITQDVAGTLYVTDTGNHTIRKITAGGTVTTLAGSAGNSGFIDGSGSTARFSAPVGIALGPDGDLYVADRDNHVIRRVTTAGVVSTYAGSSSGFTNGAPLTARFSLPRGVAVAADGQVFVADYGNLRVRRIARSGSDADVVSTLAGDGTNTAAAPDGPGATAGVPFPTAIGLRDSTLVVSDELQLLRQIDTATAVVTTLTGSRLLGYGYADGPPSKARLSALAGIAPMASGGGYLVADGISLRSVSGTGVVRTIASSRAPSTADGIGTLGQLPIFMGPSTRQALTVDPTGNVIIADVATNLVRRIAPSGAVTLVAGLSDVFPDGVVDGAANEAKFVDIGPIASDSSGVLYATDGYAVRRIATNNTVTVFAGSRTEYGSVDGNAITARFRDLQGLAVGPAGDVFVSADRAIRRIDSGGNVTTYAGASGQYGDVDGPASTARFQFPRTLAFAPDGTLYVEDSGAIRRVSADGLDVDRMLGVAFGGGLAVDAAGTLYYADAVAGLTMVTGDGTSKVLIPKGPDIILGSAPTLNNVFGIAVLAPKRLVLQTGFALLVATLP